MTQNYEVRLLWEAELKPAMELCWKVFCELDIKSARIRNEFRQYIGIRNILQGYRSGWLKLWGCFWKGKLVGVLCAQMPAYLNILFVDKDHRGKGNGQALLDELIAYLREKDVAKTLNTYAFPEGTPSYRQLGFYQAAPEQVVARHLFIPMALDL